MALVRCAELPEPDHDEAPMLKAFSARGHRVELLGWDGGNKDQGVVDGAALANAGGLGRFDLLIVRATWNYHLETERFLGWVRTASEQTVLRNSAKVIADNTHKSYLVRLRESGVRTIPTLVVEAGKACDLRAAADILGAFSVVLKPCVSGSSFMTGRFDLSDPAEVAGAEELARRLSALGDWMVQPTMSGFAKPGERCLVRIGGVWTHAVAKRPRFAGEDERVSAGEPPSEDEVELGENALSTLAVDQERLLYARVDVVQDVDGIAGPPDVSLISEVELIEPSLFFFLPGGAAAATQLVRAAETAAGD